MQISRFFCLTTGRIGFNRTMYVQSKLVKVYVSLLYVTSMFGTRTSRAFVSQSFIIIVPMLAIFSLQR